MNSLPTIQPTLQDQQWSIIRHALENSGMNLETMSDVINALLLVTDTGGYGKVYISVIGGLVQEIKIEQVKRVEKLIMRVEKKPV